MKTINVETLRTWLEEGRAVTVLDIRPAHESVEWFIPGSVHFDAYDALKASDPQALAGVELPGDIPVVTVCAAGKTSLVAAQQLQARGIQALSLEGGMKAWSLAWNIAEVPLPGSQARVIQVRRTGKGCLSYLIGAGNTAAVIDASLDPRVYLDLAHHYGWRIEYVLDTHIHADHLSRSRQLAQVSGAKLLLPDQTRVSFPFTPIHDGDTLEIGTTTLAALRTPGHTPESTCYLLDQHVLLTGDTLFPIGVGRPDLAADPGEVRRRASDLYSSLHTLLALPPETMVLPGHTSTPVTFDGDPIASTLAGIQEQVEVIHATREVFIQQILARIPPTPPNYERIVKLNEEGVLPERDITELEAGANRCAIS
jgi:glyoxylase-like metal-dependent hydrolase (beta-lactamase superfamily II)/rhodanese-related sulfurtransferase